VSQAIAFNNQNEGEPMRYSRLLQTLVLFAATAVPAATYAQSFRAYLSSTGSDTHPCTVSQPCRLLPAALNAIELNGGAIANISNIRCAGFASWCVHLPGLTAGPETRASVSDSIMANGWGGVGLNNGVANVASRASVTRSTMTGMTYGVGVACDPGLCTATISANQIHGNSFGVYTNGGVVESAQNNSLRQNGTNVSGTPLMNVGQQ
jgi:hypothetical protein